MHLVSLSAVTWDFPLVGRTRMLTESWLRRGQATTFVQVPSYRSAWERLSTARRPRQLANVVRPWPTWPARCWPSIPSAVLRRSIARRARALRRQLDTHVDWDEAVALVVSPVWAPWLAALPFRAVVYDCIDDLKVHVPTPQLRRVYDAWEAELLERASGVVASAQILGDGLRARRPELAVVTIRNGVDCEDFQRRAREAPRPSDLPRSGRPCVGFVGALYEWIDWELVGRVVAGLPDLDFVFVGPRNRSGRTAGGSSEAPNLFFLGVKPYAEVPAYIAAFDACWIPFKRDRVAAAANPVKLYEYLALGKPVVSTPVADPESFGGLVAFVGGSNEMIDELRRAVRDEGARGEDRVAFARTNSWDARASEIVEYVGALLGERFREA